MDTTTPALVRGDSGYDAPVNEYSGVVPEEEGDEGVPSDGGDRGLSAENMKGWWRELESVQVSLLPDKEGWFLQKYKVESDVSVVFMRKVLDTDLME
jgi:sorting nexin-8